MTRTYALRKLLEHGPLTFPELLQITRWEREQLAMALDELDMNREVMTTTENFRFNTRYELAR
jgi:hypothetical protein